MNELHKFDIDECFEDVGSPMPAWDNLTPDQLAAVTRRIEQARQEGRLSDDRPIHEIWAAPLVIAETTPKTVEELLLDLMGQGSDARLLLLSDGDGRPHFERIADSTTWDEFNALCVRTGEIEHARSIHAVYSPEELDALMTPEVGFTMTKKCATAMQEHEAKFPQAETNAMVKAAKLQFIAETKGTLIRKVKVLIARGYLPIGVVVPSSTYNEDATAGYLPKADALRIMEAFHSGCGLKHPDRNADLDLGTMERSVRDLEIV
jgi:hypothetical protein